jgi:hypothetical protein
MIVLGGWMGDNGRKAAFDGPDNATVIHEFVVLAKCNCCSG